MNRPKRPASRAVDSIKFAASALRSVARAGEDQRTYQLRSSYREVASRPQAPAPRNTSDTILGPLGEVVIRHPKPVSLSPACCWDESLAASPMEVSGAIIEFVDNHAAAIPASCFPPERDIQRFLTRVQDLASPATLPTQPRLAL